MDNDFLSHIINNEDFKRFICRKVEVEDGKCHPLLPIIRYLYLFNTLESFTEKIYLFEQLDNSEKEQLKENCIKLRDMYDTDETMAFENISTATNLRMQNKECLPS